VFLEREHLRGGDRLIALKPGKKSLGGRTAGAAFGGEEFNDDRGTRCSRLRMGLRRKRAGDMVQQHSGDDRDGKEEQRRKENAQTRRAEKEHGS